MKITMNLKFNKDITNMVLKIYKLDQIGLPRVTKLDLKKTILFSTLGS